MSEDTKGRLLFAAFVLPFLLVLATCGYNGCRAARSGNHCEFYRYSPQKDVPVTCAEYLKAHPESP
jgi:hypothetical protein